MTGPSRPALRHGIEPDMPGRRPVGANVARVGLALALSFAVLAAGAGYWQVLQAAPLSHSPDNPAVIAAARNVIRGTIRDRDGTVLASNKKDANGEPYRTYRDRAASGVIGYASRLYGTAGIERAFNAELTGVTRADPVADLLKKFEADPYDPQDLTLSLSLPLQKLAVSLLGNDRGAVVMLDPKTGEVLVMASTPTYDASKVANPATSEAAFKALQADDGLPLLPRPTQGRYVPGSIFKIVTAIAGLGSGAIEADTTFPEQPKAETDGLLVSGFRVREHPGVPARLLDMKGATELSSNIYYALVALRTGGDELADWAGRVGFGAPLDFDLPTAPSQVTNGGGSFGGGFSDDVELANAGYGQAETLVTPLQMALVAACVANDGVMMRPHLVTSLAGKSGSTAVAPRRIADVLAPNDARSIQLAMQQAVEGRLGRQFTTGAKVAGVPTAGKSGTAELGGTGEPHSWFIGFAPVDDPQIAIAVLVERGGRGGERAAPLAGRMMTEFFKRAGR